MFLCGGCVIEIRLGTKHLLSVTVVTLQCEREREREREQTMFICNETENCNTVLFISVTVKLYI